MAASPLELRQHKRQATALSARSGRMQWKAICSVCGIHFEGLSGLHNLACHAGMHAVHARVARLRRDELQGTRTHISPLPHALPLQSAHHVHAADGPALSVCSP
jgi:hypothetical protein